VLLTKGIAVEGASILARECEGLLALRGVVPEVLERARAFLHRPGISVQPDARIALATTHVSAMHDPTEGGLATGLLELALAAGVGLRIEQAAIPILPECQTLCRALGLDPLGVIASGALLLTCPPEEADRLVAAWDARGIAGRIIGEVTPPEAGCRLVGVGGEVPLPRFVRDEVARLFDEGPPLPTSRSAAAPPEANGSAQASGEPPEMRRRP
jgi:hydrogenase maturation factor